MPSDKKDKGSSEEKVAFTIDDEKEMDGTLPEGNELDSSKVKFVNGGTAAEAVVDVEGKTHVHKNAFVGLSKEELMEYEKDPYWIKVRWVLLILFWITWVAMLVAAIVIIVVAPKCPPRPDLQWWQSSIVYNVYPRSFKDGSKIQDGVGDLAGLKEKVDHLKDELGVSAIYMNPIFPSGGQDTGYDITNFTAIDEKFGTIDEFSALMKNLHKKEMRVVLDFVPNHSSDKHEWFIKSRQREDPYTDYYVWRNGSGAAVPPNNWLSVFGKSAWTYDNVRKQWYLHQFLSSQPDLNLRNEAVKEELKEIMLFWIENGVDGFRVDAAAHLFESKNFEDEPLSGTDANKDDYDYLDHKYTTFQPETFEILTEWRVMLENIKKDDGKERVLMVEAYPKTANQTQSLYHYNDKPAAHMPTNMALIDLDVNCDATCIQGLVDDYMQKTEGTEYWRNWQTGNHDKSRVATRIKNENLVNAVNMMLLTLPGTPISYYGEEIGMHDVTIDPSQKQDMAGDRDPQRTPMQWSGDKFAGFTTGNKTWLPVAADYKERNVKAQKAHGAGVTNIEVYSEVSKLHKEPSILWGDFHSGVYEGIYFYVRQARGFEGYLIAINFGPSAVNINFPAVAPGENLIPDLGMIVATTGNIEGDSRAAELAVGNEVTLDNLRIFPNEGLIFKWKPEAVNQQM